MKRTMLCVLLILLSSILAAAQSSFFERIEGDWMGTGKVNGMESNITMNWRPALAGKHISLTFRNQMKGGPLFEANAYYRVGKNGDVSGHWFDSFGYARPVKGTADDDSFTADWGTPETEQGRTVYKLTGPDSMEVTDSVRSKNGWREFGKAVYTRAADQKTVVRQFVEAYNKSDLDRMMSLVTEEVAWYKIEVDRLRTMTKGKEKLRELLVPYFEGELSTNSVIESLQQSGPFVSATERVGWKDKEGIQKSQAALIIYEFKEGKISAVWDFPAFP